MECYPQKLADIHTQEETVSRLPWRKGKTHSLGRRAAGCRGKISPLTPRPGWKEGPSQENRQHMEVGCRPPPEQPGLLLPSRSSLQRYTQAMVPSCQFPRIPQAPSPKFSLLTPTSTLFPPGHPAGTSGPSKQTSMWRPFPHRAARPHMELDSSQAAMPFHQLFSLKCSHPTHSQSLPKR